MDINKLKKENEHLKFQMGTIVAECEKVIAKYKNSYVMMSDFAEKIEKIIGFER